MSYEYLNFWSIWIFSGIPAGDINQFLFCLAEWIWTVAWVDLCPQLQKWSAWRFWGSATISVLWLGPSWMPSLSFSNTAPPVDAWSQGVSSQMRCIWKWLSTGAASCSILSNQWFKEASLLILTWSFLALGQVSSFKRLSRGNIRRSTLCSCLRSLPSWDNTWYFYSALQLTKWLHIYLFFSCLKNPCVWSLFPDCEVRQWHLRDLFLFWVKGVSIGTHILEGLLSLKPGKWVHTELPIKGRRLSVWTGR